VEEERVEISKRIRSEARKEWKKVVGSMATE
jgi:hypothetical protein